ncbi:putative white-brown complex homolog protein 30 isoform X2 [Tachyglossus aculeatus]|uniref:putative white-brown complex homolog protein 30 isoform X2 n=1 Tax=Tachyglossus aculeatus TaxID=9261 RepID=UPI0018F34352|nr:putative white-brown complex homolog protein 30 isoform X2 [Tachyglossus aculeatus]XP_038610783.1 putative white-brown complex homolog protein 30 isoform X2 [Tachyglossus aculeatus]XP_038610784.1 putative white-brown complex homolog protein 30 isoform X2 [Tachyglossus aculeatus]XP_038610785.1 putative white-brown complex homolog protein 30 isoform X2 [Tachyglossus aculeatus]XP_038610786.1 putative white-brown complex homolog protein 30 isoform X2 [Tachyglossus aculeatus]
MPSQHFKGILGCQVERGLLALPSRTLVQSDPVTYPCPPGYYCPGGREFEGRGPQECPENTYQAELGAWSQRECQPCPPGYDCPTPGLSSYEDHLCPPGHWCPGKQRALLCPPGTFRTQLGATSWEECEPCPPGLYCPDPLLTGLVNVRGIPCRPGYECPRGSMSETLCRAGSFCGPQTGIPPMCPGGYACPEVSSTYRTVEQLQQGLPSAPLPFWALPPHHEL